MREYWTVTYRFGFTWMLMDGDEGVRHVRSGSAS